MITLLLTIITFSFVGKSQTTQGIPKFDFDIVERKIVGDTLKVVLDSDFMFYPFGIYKSNIDFCNNYPLFQEVPTIRTVRFSNKYWSYAYKESTLLVLLSDESERIEVVESEIENSEISLINNIKIGMSKSDFFETFKLIESAEYMSRMNVVVLESALLGIWHTYSFNDNKLTSIKMVTDYQY